jgi:dTDP-4-amino-4,6-dideoxygalactose transaminase
MSAIEFFRHDLGQREVDAVAEVLQGAILTTGETVHNFERHFADYLGCRHVIGVTSCTGAMHLSLLALGIGAEDEVITTPMTFIATATAIIEAGAKPVFVDVEPHTGNLDAMKVEAAISPHTRAILPVHLYGQMCDMRALHAIADRHGLAIIEDAAHCVEGMRDQVRVGQLGDTACFSFYATKNLTCGEGGAIATNSDELAKQLHLLRHHGMTRTAYDRAREGYRHWDMVTMGWKYNMDNIQAALLLPQLDRLELNWKKRLALATYYQERLAQVSNLQILQTQPSSRNAWHLFPVWVPAEERDRVITSLQGMGIPTVVNYRAIHLLSYFRETFGFRPGDFPVAETLGDTVLSLPFYPAMPFSHVDRIVEALTQILGAHSTGALMATR